MSTEYYIIFEVGNINLDKKKLVENNYNHTLACTVACRLSVIYIGSWSAVE